MVYRSGATARPSFALICGMAMVALLSLLPGRFAAAQEAPQTGTINGRVVDERGAGISGAQVFLVRPAIGSQTGADGNYSLRRVPAGTHTVGVRMLGFRPDSASVTVQAGGTATQDFTLGRDPLQLQEMVVTGTQSPRTNLDASVAVTTLSAQEVHQAAPRSTTEMLRYVPGFTRVESSGGEVNQNVVIRGILDQEFVMFMEDGMPVFPTMHTYFMNADNLFRFDENIERMEVVRGGASALFGSNTPGAIINYINKTGGGSFAGTMRATAGTHGLARYDLNAGGPMGDDWRFNVGGFYRYDHGVRDPGFPGIRGGQLKANVTRQLSNGYLRASVKHIDDRNQFVLPLPLNDPRRPRLHQRLQQLWRAPQQRGRRHPGADAGGRSDLAARQRPQNQGDLVHGGRVSGTGGRLVLPEHCPGDAERPGAQCDRPGEHLHGRRLCNQSHEPGRFAPLSRGEHLPVFLHQPLRRRRQQAAVRHPERFRDSVDQWHVAKPISAIQDQLQLRKTFGRHTVALGAYFANYTQDNHWNFTDILIDARDNPRFLDLVVTPPAGSPVEVTRNGFRNFFSLYRNGTGQASIVSGVLGAEIQLTDRLRADIGGRVEYDNFVQSAEQASAFDLDENPATTFDNETFGNGSFRHFSRDITDWAASVGLNFRMSDNVSFYAAGARGYKMPELDSFLGATSQDAGGPVRSARKSGRSRGASRPRSATRPLR